MLIVVTAVLAADLRAWRRWLPPIAGACVLFTLAPGWFFIGSGLRGFISSLGWFAGVVAIGLVAPGLDLAWKHLPRHPRVPTSATPTAA